MMYRSISVFIGAVFAVVLSLIGAVPSATQASDLPDYVIEQFGTPPPVPEGPLSDELRAAIQTAIIDTIVEGEWDPNKEDVLLEIGASGDPRVAWVISDILRFTRSYELNIWFSRAAAETLGIETPGQNFWGVITDHLIAWDIPAPPEYLDMKRTMFTAVLPNIERIFAEGDVDWRHVSWGGVLIDDRPMEATDDPCNCIPAADNPEVESAENAWLEEDQVVFGIVVNGQARAYPRSIMEVREMVNDTLGGRDLGIPYCTLCGAAQAYFTDDLPEGVERPILRTSGLLSRSNKVMYDLNTYSVFDTFLGKALTGPLAEKGVVLKQASVVTTTWGEWKAAHPDTTVLKERYALGRDPDFRNTRDANGPIFPVGDVDPRLSVHEDVIGVITASGTPVAFQRTAAMLALQNGEEITFENVHLELDGGGVKAVDADGSDIGSHQAFWFAWSQFYPDTELWSG
ncbi:MAG: DUF3179 domain-containing (seleno)protein [Pseudomonadota bacterium]